MHLKLYIILFVPFYFLSFIMPCTGQKKKSEPNVLVLLVDEWRAQATGYSGDRNVKTPNLDQLAAKSANFSMATSALPVCTPWRASFMTGQRPLTNGIFMNDMRLDTNAVTIAKVYAKRGYKTGYIGKWHLDGQYRLSYTPPGLRRQGFQYWKAINCNHNYNHSAYYEGEDSTKKYWDGYDVFAQTKDANKYIRDNAHNEQPFFLTLSWAPPHDPYHTAPEKYKKLYDPSKLILRPNVPDSMQAKVRFDLAGYYSHMSAIDDMVGEVLKVLEEEGILYNTIILFTSDHGDLLGSHGDYFKQQPYDESIRVPMLFHYTGDRPIKAGVYGAMIGAEDIMPTLLGLSNIKIPKTVEGKNFSKYLRGKGTSPKDSVALITNIQPFGQWIRSKGGKEFRGIRTPHYTYVRDLNGPWLLFDNINDPYQMRNLVNNQRYSHLQSQLNKLLLQKLKNTNDKFLPGSVYLKEYNYPLLDSNETVPIMNWKGSYE